MSIDVIPNSVQNTNNIGLDYGVGILKRRRLCGCSCILVAAIAECLQRHYSSSSIFVCVGDTSEDSISVFQGLPCQNPPRRLSGDDQQCCRYSGTDVSDG